MMPDVPPAAVAAAAAGAFPTPPTPHGHARTHTIPAPSPILPAAAAQPHDAPEDDDDDVSLGSLGTAIDMHEALRQFTTTSSTPAAAFLEPATCAFPVPPLPSSFSTMPMPRSSSSPACSADQTFRQLESRLIAKQVAKQAGVVAMGKECWFILGAAWHRTWSSYVLGTTGSTPPPALSNTTLRDPRTQRVRQGLVADLDYIAVPPVVWFIFALLYGEDEEDEKEAEKSTTATATTTPSRVICRFHTNVYGAEVPPSVVKEISRRAQQQAHVAVDRLMRRQHQALLRLGGGGGAGGSGCEGGVLLPAGGFAAATGARTNSIVTESSCCSSSASLYQERKDRRGGGGDESYIPATHRKTPPLRFGVSRPRPGSSGAGSNDGDESMEGEKSGGPWCLRRLYGCCFLLLPSSFLNFARERLVPSSSSAPSPPRGQEHTEVAEDGEDGRDDDIHSIISSSFSLRSLMEDDEEEGEDHDLLLLWRNRRRL